MDAAIALEREDGTWVELPESYAWLDAEKRRERQRMLAEEIER